MECSDNLHAEKGNLMLKPNLVCLLGLVIMILLAGASGDTGTSVTPTPAPTAPSVEPPHAKRLADLRKEREGIQTSIAIEREVAKKLAGDAMKLSREPLPDPDERRDLIEQMDQEHQRVEELLEKLKLIDAGIAEEEQQSAHEEASTAEPSQETHTEVTAPRTLSADEIHRLTKQRQYDSDLIAAVDGILNATAASERVEIYCRFTVDQMESLAGTNDPDKSVRDFAHRANIDRCKAAVLAGSQSMPDADQLRQKAEQAKQGIAEIDAKLKSGQ